jgi:hypothetical protein
MRYYPPIGSVDPNAPYIDDNPAAGQEGSAVPAKAVEHPQREIVTVLMSVGMEPDETRVDQLNEAIDLKIDLATGGGDNPLSDLLSLLRGRLRIFPEILTANGTFNLLQPTSNTVRVPAGIDILHRGVFQVTTAQQDFTHVANKVYHLRYRFTGTPGWAFMDVLDSGYNPGALAEGNVAFDSGYDDMITHRIVTDPSNVATITPLINRNRLSVQALLEGINPINQSAGDARWDIAHSINWARRPTSFNLALAKATNVGGASDTDFSIRPAGASRDDLFDLPPLYSLTRYGISQRVLRAFSRDLFMNFSAEA